MPDRELEAAASRFVASACVPRDSAHSSGRLERADEILAAQPSVATASIHTAAILGDAAAVARFITADPSSATSTGGPYGWDALTHLCFSNYLKLRRDRSDGFVRATRALLEAGASAMTGFAESGDGPHPVFESALYGACGVAHHAELTQLLLEHGADPNDEEVVYHSAETYDNEALHRLVESGRLTADSLATLLLRKCDWHDVDGIRWLLERGADATRETRWNASVLHHALSRDNDLEIIQLLLDHRADPFRRVEGVTAIAAAARGGRGDVLDAMSRRGTPLRVDGRDALLAACARGHGAAASAIAQTMPAALYSIRSDAGLVLSRFAGIGNTPGLRLLLELGLPPDSRRVQGFGYFDIAAGSTPLHVAAWRARHTTVRLLIESGADVDARDGADRTPLQLAVRACVDSYWTDRRSPESVALLLKAGASTLGVRFPCGYEAVDALLAQVRTSIA